MRRLLLLFLVLCWPGWTADLTINAVNATAKAMVFDLPSADGRADAVEYVKKIHDRFMTEKALLNASTMGERPAELKDGFMLYATLDSSSKLVRHSASSLGWKIAGGKFEWRGLSVPVAKLRFIHVIRNPYGSGFVTVYAGGSNAAVSGINGVFQGPSSYYVYDDKVLLREGSYGEDLRIVESLRRSEALEDVQQFFSTLERVHPNLLARRNAADYAKLRGDVEASLRDGMAVGDLASQLYYAAAWFGDGHTSVQWRSSPDPAAAYPPFALRYDNGRFVLADSWDELVAVNDKPVRVFLAPILDRCSGETIQFRAARFLGNQAFWYSLTRLLGTGGSLKLTLRDADGRTSVRNAHTTTLAKFRELLTKGPGEPAQGGGTTVEFVDDGKVAHFIYPSFVLKDQEKKKVDQIFAEVKQKGSRDLIVDLRGNGGGNSGMCDHILSYLTRRPVRQFSEVRMKLSPETRNFISVWAKAMAWVTHEKVYSEPLKEKKLPERGDFFEGRTWLLIDNRTFSSATDFAAMFRDYEVGTIVGYETGGVPSSFGDVLSFSLKRSGISCGVSWKQFVSPRPKPGDDERGVQPNVPLTDKLLTPFRSAPDPVLAFTLQEIRNSRGR